MRTAFDVGLARAMCCRPPPSVLGVVVAYLKLAYISRVADKGTRSVLRGRFTVSIVRVGEFAARVNCGAHAVQ